jgi:hypothetical protein
MNLSKLTATAFAVLAIHDVICAADNPVLPIDLLDVTTAEGLERVYGISTGNGEFGVPVATGKDVDGDQFVDYALATMTNSSLGRAFNGSVSLVFGNGVIGGTIDTAVVQPGVLRIAGASTREHAGSEIWIDDVTGDGLGDLLICRQDYEPTVPRSGAGAMTILPGGSHLRDFANTQQILDLSPLAIPNPAVPRTTLVGSDFEERFCIWVRTGDIDGDGIADMVVGADRKTIYPGNQACDGVGNDDCDNGVADVVRGGDHLASGATFEMINFGSPTFGLAGDIAEIRPPAPAVDFHFGATVQIADLDGNGRGEVLIAAALARAGASLAPPNGSGNGSGGPTDGTLFVAWDDHFPQSPWADGYTFVVNSVPGLATIINGGAINVRFGEEILGGLDYDGNGEADLFVGDIVGDPPGRNNAGLGHIFFQAAQLKGLSFDLDSPPPGIVSSTIYGPVQGAIGADTAAQGDFNGDGIADLAFSSPHDNPFSRFHAGTIHVFMGQEGAWPSLIDVAPGSLPDSDLMSIVEIYGARGANGDQGDTLCYSAATGDVDGDGLVDIVTNEMLGNGVSTLDDGNLIVISGDLISGLIFEDGFETGDSSRWSSTSP